MKELGGLPGSLPELLLPLLGLRVSMDSSAACRDVGYRARALRDACLSTSAAAHHVSSAAAMALQTGASHLLAKVTAPVGALWHTKCSMKHPEEQNELACPTGSLLDARHSTHCIMLFGFVLRHRQQNVAPFTIQGMAFALLWRNVKQGSTQRRYNKVIPLHTHICCRDTLSSRQL